MSQKSLGTTSLDLWKVHKFFQQFVIQRKPLCLTFAMHATFSRNGAWSRRIRNFRAKTIQSCFDIAGRAVSTPSLPPNWRGTLSQGPEYQSWRHKGIFVDLPSHKASTSQNGNIWNTRYQWNIYQSIFYSIL